MLYHNETLGSLDADLKLAHESHPEGNLIPTSRRSFRKLLSFLHSEASFFPTCANACRPYPATAEKCDGCKKSLWTVKDGKKKPEGLFFGRDLAPWIQGACSRSPRTRSPSVSSGR